MSNTFSPAADLTGRLRHPGVGMDHMVTFIKCPLSHKGTRTGAQFVTGRGWMRCAKCFAELKARTHPA